jgi:hypothetical protein
MWMWLLGQEVRRREAAGRLLGGCWEAAGREARARGDKKGKEGRGEEGEGENEQSVTTPPTWTRHNGSRPNKRPWSHAKVKSPISEQAGGGASDALHAMVTDRRRGGSAPGHGPPQAVGVLSPSPSPYLLPKPTQDGDV